MKTIKRALLSVILLQTACQPVHAAISFDLETARNAAASVASYVPSQSELVKIGTQMGALIKTLGIGLIATHIVLVMYDWHLDNQIGQNQQPVQALQQANNNPEPADYKLD